VRAHPACEPSDSFDREAGPRGPHPELSELTPFSVFCFSLSRDEFHAFLEEHALDRESLSRAGFDAESARLDIQVAPEGISRVELARTLFEELRKPDEPTPL
jgi:hypothetical protein